MMDIKYEYGDQSDIYKDAIKIRKTVFIEEQGVPEDIELDHLDYKTTHYVGYVDGEPVTTARIYEDPIHEYHLQRVATLKEHRGKGYGKELVIFIERSLRHKPDAKIWLSAQDTALPFYKKMGYSTLGDGFMEADIPHHSMEKFINS